MTAFTDETIVELAPDDSTLTEAGILVVDEDPAFQLGLKTFLKEYVGFEKVFTARSGQEAIDLIGKEESIELLTVDFQMPGMDGIELLQHLRDNAPRPLGVTMITGFPSEKLRKEFAKLTSSKLLTNHFLAKPVEFEKLEPVILDSYEELKRSQMLTETMTGGDDFPEEQISVSDLNAMAIAASNRELSARFDRLEEKLDQHLKTVREARPPGAGKSFVVDVLKLLVAAAIAWGVWQSGVLSGFGPDRAKAGGGGDAVPSLPAPGDFPKPQ
ncbi:MAG: response regulator [Verrucomicrobiales bacterium]|nr:response regulator [Verrucomicrobiales bacterium]